MEDLTQEFIAESREGLDRMERCLTTLETRPQDPELLGEIFRAVHSIKGTTGFLGFGRLEALAHAGENLLGLLRDGRLAVTGELISGLLDLLDGLRRILAIIEIKGSEGSRTYDEDSALIAMLGQLAAKADGDAGALAIGRVGEFAAPQMTLEAPKPMRLPDDGRTASEAVWNEMGEAIRGVAQVGVEHGGTSEKTLRIDVDVLNRMMDLVGELVLTRNQILQSSLSAEQFAELRRRLDSVTGELRETVMQVRMQPVGNLFNKFPRMVRDLAKTCGKMVRIEFAGQETGLDKSLLEALRDPLTHAIRNAVDHGIESPMARARAGKEAEGLVRLGAFHQGGMMVIEVADDGGGIAIERVREKAIERRLVTAERARGMGENEVLQMVFLPGFSTAEAVTHVSGRGVGMDVVRANIEKVGGSVELESVAARGTTLRLRVPLTLAIVPALVVMSGGQSFAVPQSALVELIHVGRDKKEAVERIGEAEVYRWQERLLPMVRLDVLLEMKEKHDGEADGFYLAVVEIDGARFGLVVDALLDPEEIVVKPLSIALREIGMFSGAAVLGNGTLSLILDVGAVAARARVKDRAPESLEAAVCEAVKAAEERFVVFDGGWPMGDRRAGALRETMAIPLEQVERIESVPVEEIEYAGGGYLLQYREETIALEDAGGMLAGAQEKNAAVTALICVRGGRRVAVMVREVFQVTEGERVAPVAERGGERMALVDGRMRTIYEGVSYDGASALAVLGEVA